MDGDGRYEITYRADAVVTFPGGPLDGGPPPCPSSPGRPFAIGRGDVIRFLDDEPAGYRLRRWQLPRLMHLRDEDFEIHGTVTGRLPCPQCAAGARRYLLAAYRAASAVLQASA